MIRNTLAAVAAAAILAPFAASAETPDTQNVQEPAGVAAPVTAAPVAPPTDVAPPSAQTSPDAQAAPAGPPTADTAQAAPNVPTAAFTEAQLQAFAEASVEIEAIKSRADANGGLNAESTAAIRESLSSHQLTLDSYNAIVAAIQTDTVLAERVASLRTQAATTEGVG